MIDILNHYTLGFDQDRQKVGRREDKKIRG